MTRLLGIAVAIAIVLSAAILFLALPRSGHLNYYNVANVSESNLTFANSGFTSAGCASRLVAPLITVTNSSGVLPVSLSYGAYGNITDYLIQDGSTGRINFTLSQLSAPWFNSSSIYVMGVMDVEEGMLVNTTNGVILQQCSGTATAAPSTSSGAASTSTCTNTTTAGATGHYVSATGDNYSVGYPKGANGTTVVPKAIMFYSNALHGISFEASPRSAPPNTMSAAGALNITTESTAQDTTYLVAFNTQICGPSSAHFLVTVGTTPYGGPMPEVSSPG
jgi:hypothetical protein